MLIRNYSVKPVILWQAKRQSRVALAPLWEVWLCSLISLAQRKGTKETTTLPSLPYMGGCNWFDGQRPPSIKVLVKFTKPVPYGWTLIFSATRWEVNEGINLKGGWIYLLEVMRRRLIKLSLKLWKNSGKCAEFGMICSRKYTKSFAFSDNICIFAHIKVQVVNGCC